MPWGVILPLVLAALVVFLLAVFVRRASRALGRTREVAGFQREASDLARRLDATLAGLGERVDAVRRHQLPPEEVEAEVNRGLESLQAYLDQAHAIRTLPELAENQRLIAEDIERGARALEMVAYGCRIAASNAGRRGELEAQTAIKRGYLNLMHARDSVNEHLEDLSQARESGAQKWRTSRI